MSSNLQVLVAELGFEEEDIHRDTLLWGTESSSPNVHHETDDSKPNLSPIQVFGNFPESFSSEDAAESFSLKEESGFAESSSLGSSFLSPVKAFGINGAAGCMESFSHDDAVWMATYLEGASFSELQSDCTANPSPFNVFGAYEKTPGQYRGRKRPLSPATPLSQVHRASIFDDALSLATDKGYSPSWVCGMIRSSIGASPMSLVASPPEAFPSSNGIYKKSMDSRPISILRKSTFGSPVPTFVTASGDEEDPWNKNHVLNGFLSPCAWPPLICSGRHPECQEAQGARLSFAKKEDLVEVEGNSTLSRDGNLWSPLLRTNDSKKNETSLDISDINEHGNPCKTSLFPLQDVEVFQDNSLLITDSFSLNDESGITTMCFDGVMDSDAHKIRGLSVTPIKVSSGVLGRKRALSATTPMSNVCRASVFDDAISLSATKKNSPPSWIFGIGLSSDGMSPMSLVLSSPPLKQGNNVNVQDEERLGMNVTPPTSFHGLLVGSPLFFLPSGEDNKPGHMFDGGSKANFLSPCSCLSLTGSGWFSSLDTQPTPSPFVEKEFLAREIPPRQGAESLSTQSHATPWIASSPKERAKSNGSPISVTTPANHFRALLADINYSCDTGVSTPARKLDERTSFEDWIASVDLGSPSLTPLDAARKDSADTVQASPFSRWPSSVDQRATGPNYAMYPYLPRTKTDALFESMGSASSSGTGSTLSSQSRSGDFGHVNSFDLTPLSAARGVRVSLGGCGLFSPAKAASPGWNTARLDSISLGSNASSASSTVDPPSLSSHGIREFRDHNLVLTPFSGAKGPPPSDPDCARFGAMSFEPADSCCDRGVGRTTIPGRRRVAFDKVEVFSPENVGPRRRFPTTPWVPRSNATPSTLSSLKDVTNLATIASPPASRKTTGESSVDSQVTRKLF